MSIVDGAGMFDAVAGVRSVFKLSARDIRSNARAVGGDRVEVRRSLWYDSVACCTLHGWCVVGLREPFSACHLAVARMRICQAPFGETGQQGTIG